MVLKPKNKPEAIIAGYLDQISFLDKELAVRDDEVELLNSRLLVKISNKFHSFIMSPDLPPHKSVLRWGLAKASRLYSKPKSLLLRRSMQKELDTVLRQIYDTHPDMSGDSKGTISVGLIMRNGNYRPQSSGFIRLISPLTWNSKNDKVSIKLFDGDANIEDSKGLKDVNAVVVQRTAFSSVSMAKRFVEDCKSHNIPIFVDLDDAMSLLERTHSQYQLQLPGIEAMNYVIDNSEELWVSTTAIAKSYKNSTSRVLKNYIDPRLWPSPSRGTSTGDVVRMVYMGTQTHSEDLNMLISALDKVYALKPNSFSLTIIGIAKHIPHRPYIKSTSPDRKSTLYPRFTEWFTRESEKFDIGLAPLIDTPFNNAKTDIKSLDYLMVGCGVLASNVEPYKDSDLADYIELVDNDDDGWFKSLHNLVTDENHLSTLLAKSEEAKDFINQNRTVNIVSREIVDTIRKSIKAS